MGYYIQADSDKNKAAWLIRNHGAKVIDPDVAFSLVCYGDKIGVVCVVDNGPFEAAAFIFSVEEFDAFAYDSRPKTWLVMDYDTAARLSGYKE